MTAIAAHGALTVSPIVIPETLDAPDAAGFIEGVLMWNAVSRHDAGHDHLDQQPAEALGFWHDQTDRTSIGFEARRDGRLVGAVTISIANEESATTAEFDLIVEPERRGEGIEEGAARGHGTGRA